MHAAAVHMRSPSSEQTAPAIPTLLSKHSCSTGSPRTPSMQVSTHAPALAMQDSDMALSVDSLSYPC